MPPETRGQGFEVNVSLRINEVLAPLTDVVPSAYWRADVQIWRLKVNCVSNDGCFWIRPYRAEPPVPARKAARQAAEADTDGTDSEELGRSSGSDGTPQIVRFV